MRNVQLVVRVILLLLATVSPHALRADQYRFLLRHDSEELQNGMVCFFPGIPVSFASQYLSSHDVRCVRSDRLISIPVGGWNVYATHDDGFVSTHPDFFVVPPDLPEGRVDRTLISMVPAGEADLRAFLGSLRTDEHTVLYIPNEGRPQSLATARPVASGEEIVAVPADMTIVPLAVQSGRITAVGNPFVTAAGGTASVHGLTRDASGTTVIVQLTVEPEWLERLADLHETPEIWIETSDHRMLHPILPLRSGSEWVRSRLFFRDVPPGKAVLHVAGRMWQEIEAIFDVGSSEAQLLAPPVELAPSGALFVDWQFIDSSASGSGFVRDECPSIDGVEPASTPQTEKRPNEISVIHCERWPIEASSECSMVAKVTIDHPSGVQAIGGLPAGSYRVELQYEGIVASRQVKVATLQAAHEIFELRRQGVGGRVTRGEVPMAARVQFGGAGSAVSEAATGEYYAPINAAPRGSVVTVTLCGDAGRIFKVPGPEGDLPERFDIELPDNRINITVTDAASGDGLPRANVMVSVASAAADEGDAYSDAFVANSEGSVVVENVTSRAFVKVCADQIGYLRRCTERFRLSSIEEKDIAIVLPKVTAREGQLLSVLPVSGARVFFVVSPGRIIASARVASDGSFTYELPTENIPLYVVVFGRNVPLHATPYAPPTGDGPFTIDSRRPSRVLTLTKATGSSVPFTLILDGMTVPRLVVDQHQSIRNRDSRVAGGGSLVVPDIAGSAIQVIVGLESPPADFMRPDVYADIFNTQPYSQTLDVIAVPRDGNVTIP